MIDILKQHFPQIFWTSVAIAAVILFLVSRLFLMLRSDAIREEKEDPTKVAAFQTLSTLRGVVRLRRASDTDSTQPRIARSSAELDMTITPGTLRADDIPKPPGKP